MSTFALICLILSLIFYTIYISYTYIKYNPNCISDTYYHLNKKWIFTVWILLVSFLIFPSWVEISPINFQFLSFLSVVTLSIVGITPKYLGEDRLVHLISAILTAIISITWNIIVGKYIILIILLSILLIITLIKVKNLLFWAENIAFINIYLSILLY